MRNSIAAVILTYNEDKHIERCIRSIESCVDEIYILDSFSTDGTLEKVHKHKKVHILQNPFVNYASQFNYALNEFDIASSWILRIDADEYLDEELQQYLDRFKSTDMPEDITGILVNRYMSFLGRRLRYGAMSSYWMLRIWRTGMGRCESTWMDEHIVLYSGRSVKARGKLIDDNLNSLSWWSHKHVDYSTREAIDVILRKGNLQNEQIKSTIFGSSAERTRFVKMIYNKCPLFIRPFFYFIYRYFIRLGFRDGIPGFLWHILQAFWYRTMVDAKVYEIEMISKRTGMGVREVIKKIYGYEV